MSKNKSLHWSYDESEAKVVTKPWGKEVWINYRKGEEIGDEEKRYVMKKLYITKGTKTSFQYHHKKVETNFLVEAGKPLGVLPVYPDVVYEKFGFFESLGMGVGHSVKFLKNQVSAFGKMFSGKIKAKDSLGSFITIGKQFGTTWDWMRFWNMTGMLSLILGFLNLLPIPALDGGHVMFLLWEVVTGRKPSDKVLEYATMAGFAILVVFMVYALGLDIMRNI